MFQPVKHIDVALKNTTPAAARFLDHKHQEEKRLADSRRARELERNGKKERTRARSRQKERDRVQERGKGRDGEKAEEDYCGLTGVTPMLRLNEAISASLGAETLNLLANAKCKLFQRIHAYLRNWMALEKAVPR